MAWNFRKRISILPGLRLNLSGNGVSVSIGPHGANVNIGKNGITGNVSIPGTGLYKRGQIYSTTSTKSKRNKAQLNKTTIIEPMPIEAIEVPTIERKATPEQKVRIDTLLKYRSAINESKVALLEALLNEGHTHVILPAGEIDVLIKLHKESGDIKRMVSFKECRK